MADSYGPNNPPRFRKPGESVEDYRVAMGWDAPQEPKTFTPWAALAEVIGCFDAAVIEGLSDALRDTQDERLRDLVERRLMYALEAARRVDGIEATAKRVFEVMGHDHQVCWDDMTSAQREFYGNVARAALGA